MDRAEAVPLPTVVVRGEVNREVPPEIATVTVTLAPATGNARRC